MDIISYALSKKIAASAVSGVSSMSVDGTTLNIDTNDGQRLQMVFPQPKDGVSVTDIDVNANNQIVFTMSDGTEFISGKIPTVKGDKGDPFKYSDFTQEQLDALKGESGISPTITENADNTDKIYKLDVTTADGTFTTPNLKGADGQGGTGASTWSEISDKPFESLSTDFSVENGELKVVGGTGGGEENVQSDWNETDDTADGFIKNKPTIPTKVSQLENDSNYLSSIPEEYVTETELSAKGYLTEHQDISGKVDKVEGKSLISDTEIARLASVDNYDDTDIKAEIAKKADTTAIPSKVSELTNDSNYQTAEQVNSTVTTEIAKVVADAPESLNTLKEMSDWIAGHEDDASAMNSAISDNKTAITALQTGKADKSEIPTTVAELTDSADYAKKTDIPTTLPADGGNSDTVNNHTVETDVPTDAKFTDTIYDDTEVKESIEELSSNLDTLEYSEVAGGKNLANINDFKLLTTNPSRYGYEWISMKGGTYTFNITNGKNILYIGYKHNGEFVNPNSVVNNSKVQTITISDGDDIVIWYENGVTENTVTKLQLEVGSVATPYEPYIPSVKMLAEEVNQQNESLENYGLDNKCTELGQGYGNFVNDDNTFVWIEQEGYFVGTKSPINCNSSDRIKVKFDITPDNIVVQWNDGTHSRVDNKKELVATAPSGVTKFCVYCSKSDITPQSVGYIGIYVNDGIDILSDNQIDLKMLGWTVPNECPVQNYVDGDGIFHQRVCRVDLGTLDWSYSSEYKRFSTSGITDYKKKDSGSNTWVADAFLKDYSTTSGNNTAIDSYNKSIGFNGNSNMFFVKNTSYTDATSFKNAMQGQYLYYELETPITMTIDGNEAISKVNESLSVIGKFKNLLNPTLQTTTLNGVTCTNNGDGTYTLNGTASSDVVLALESYKSYTGKEKFRLVGCPNGGGKDKYYLAFRPYNAEENRKDIGSGVTFNDLSTSNKYAVAIIVLNGTTVTNLTFKPMLTENLNATFDDFVPYTGDGETLTHDVAQLRNDLSPKKIELQNVDERVTIQDNGSFIINGFAFVNLLVTFNETLPQWSNFVRLPRPKGGNVSVHCENSVKLTIYSQDNLPGDCGTYDIVQSGTEVRLLVNYEVA